MAHLELAHEYAPDILALPNNPIVKHISNIWSDCYVNHYLVKQGLSHVHLSSIWEVSIVEIHFLKIIKLHNVKHGYCMSWVGFAVFYSIFLQKTIVFHHI